MSIDPTDVRIHAGDGMPLPELTEAALGDLLDTPPGRDCPILELSRGGSHEIRAKLLPDGVYEVEHRAGSAAESFQMYTSDAALVRDVLWAWLSGDPWWRDAVAWYPVDPAIAELRAVHDELAGLLDCLIGMNDATTDMDAVLARADELLASERSSEQPISTGQD
ncbi:hypothetical protein [Nocardia sp. CNY236]|uniref:hypothetical protein n=1 Tax=Nocardia sp. CNY236 TaxID=1169152 RepID=UPI0012DDC637|nr:hypothetical protein [Nocardia sp. CNY236]